MARTAAVHELMKASGDGDKPVWFTEFGWSSHAGGDKPWERGVSDQQQAEYLVRTVDVVRSRFPFVRGLFWYNERNRTDSSQVENNFGLLTHSLGEKPVYAAFKALNLQLAAR
jgi:exo-beta-1,3-glucanase (GH17 family)